MSLERFLSDLSIKEARAEYSKLRAVANKRLARLGASEFAESRTYQNWKRGFSSVKSISGDNIYKALSEVEYFLGLKTGTVSGARSAQKAFIQSMHERGYGFINKKNAAEFGEFMREVKKHKDYKGRDSEQLVDLYKTAKDKRIDPQSLARNYETWFKHEKTFEQQPRSNNIITFDKFMERTDAREGRQ